MNAHDPAPVVWCHLDAAQRLKDVLLDHLDADVDREQLKHVLHAAAALELMY